MKVNRFVVTPLVPLDVAPGQQCVAGEVLAEVLLPEGITPRQLADYYYNGQVEHELENPEPLGGGEEKAAVPTEPAEAPADETASESSEQPAE